MSLSLPRPIQNTAAYYIEALGQVLDADLPTQVYLADSTIGPGRPGDPPPFTVQAWPRVTVMLNGHQDFTISQNGRRFDLQLREGQAAFWARHGWSLDYWEPSFVFLGVVFRRKYVRYIVYDHPGGVNMGTPHFYHSAHPFSDAGTHLLWSLNALAGQNPAPGARDLIRALLHLSRHHLRQEAGSSLEDRGKSTWTWLNIQEYLNENYARPLSRDSVARAMHLHPNYLSALCMKESGITFSQALENVRTERAAHLLLHSQAGLETIALQCGFTSPIQLARAFKRTMGTTPSSYRRAGKVGQ